MNNVKECQSYPGYYASKDGRILKMRDGELTELKQRIWGKDLTARYVIGYRNDKKKRSSKLVHRLVLDAHVCPCPNGKEGCHNDGNGFNNHISNLRWDTRSNNQMDKVKHGTSNRGSQHGLSKLTEKEVLEIRDLQDALTKNELSVLYNVTPTQISMIHSRMQWAWL